MLFLESESSEKPIFLYINSPGGSVTDGLAIYDTMQVHIQFIVAISLKRMSSLFSVPFTPFVWGWLPPWARSCFRPEAREIGVHCQILV